jgi:hypothetical protein
MNRLVVFGSLLLLYLHIPTAFAATDVNQIVILHCFGNSSTLHDGPYFLKSYDGNLSVRGMKVEVGSNFPYDETGPLWSPDYSDKTPWDVVGYRATKTHLNQIRQSISQYNSKPCTEKTVEVKPADEAVLVCGPGSSIEFKPPPVLQVTVAETDVKVIGPSKFHRGEIDFDFISQHVKIEQSIFATYNACDGFVNPIR